MAYEPLIGQARLAKRMRMEMQCNPQWVLDLAAERDQLRTENVRLAEWYSEAGVREDALRAERDQARQTAEHWKAEHLAGNAVIEQLRAEVEALRKDAERYQLDPVHGDKLPVVGSKVLIHLASCDAWIEHTVVGYYAWPDLNENPSLHRVFVRVRDAEGYLNARLLKDVRIDAAMAAKEGV